MQQLSGQEIWIQFYLNNGLAIFQKYGLLNVDSINILPQLDKISINYYPSIHKINIYNEQKQLIQSSDCNLRAKVCNLIGNLCQHSSFFYQHLLKFELINLYIKCCCDPVKTQENLLVLAYLEMQNFIVICNKSIQDQLSHNQLNYSKIQKYQMIQTLPEKNKIQCSMNLRKFSQKFKQADQRLQKHGALNQLLELVKSDQTTRISLFSIGNLDQYPDVKENLKNYQSDKSQHQLLLTINKFRDMEEESQQI
ncbi:unnamed protein product [Paramecium sonneborni]|uniref:non-specific serine/threonine protein kinase n=1 Tax=Paramecium sonneborni TaxID=65129 RepID=A0A8S1KTX4_9CILI|nr:unnamed protein product [Paramecium sonneborni]